MINNKKVSVIIPTRYGSERLPGKVLIDIAGKPNIERIIERTLRSKYVDNIILAITHKNEEAFLIHKWYDSKEYLSNLKCVYRYIGDHNDVMKRTLCAAKFYEHLTDIIVMISHDCTLVCPSIIDRLLERLIEYKADYSSNVITRTFPDGFDVQVFTREIYEKIEKVIPKDHVTRMWTGWNIFHWREELYSKPRIINWEARVLDYFPEWHLCLDTPEDKILIEKIFEYFRRPNGDEADFGYYHIIDFLKCNLELLEINKSVIPAKLLRKDEA